MAVLPPIAAAALTALLRNRKRAEIQYLAVRFWEDTHRRYSLDDILRFAESFHKQAPDGPLPPRMRGSTL